MKRRMLSVITALALCLSLCPTWAFAAEGGSEPTDLVIDVGALTGVQKIEVNGNTVSMDGGEAQTFSTLVLTGTAENLLIKISHSDQVTLRDLHIDITRSDVYDTLLDLYEGSSVRVEGTVALASSGSVIVGDRKSGITGPGSLMIDYRGTDTAVLFEQGISIGGDLSISAPSGCPAEAASGFVCPITARNITLTHGQDSWYSNTLNLNAVDTLTIDNQAIAAKVAKEDDTRPDFSYLTEADLDGAFAADSGNAGTTITLLADVERTEPLQIRIACVLDLGGHTICCEQECLTVYCDDTGAPSNVTIQGKGKVISTNNTALTVWGNVTLKGGTFTSNGRGFGGVYVSNQNANLSVTGESVIIQNTGGGYGLAVNNVQSVRLSAGTYSGEAAAIFISDSDSFTLGNLLPMFQCAYFDENGAPIIGQLDQKALYGTVTVGECTHDKSVCEYTPNEDDGTHAMNCLACGRAEAEEACTYSGEYEHDETNHWQTCTLCGRKKTEAHSYGIFEPQYNGNTITIRRICESCMYPKTDGTFTVPALDQTMEYGKPITLTCTSTLPEATFQWILTDAGGDDVQKSSGASFTPSETLAVGEYYWEAIVKWAGSDTNTWSSSGSLQVTPAPLPDVTLSPASAVYNGTEQKSAVAIAGLTAGTDYTVAYTGDFTNAGTHTVTVTGQGNYEGTVTKTFTIEKAALTADGTGTASGTYGAKLSDLTVTDLTAKLGEAPVTGTWKLTGDAIPNAGNTETHAAAFTPAGGGENYKPLTAQVTLNIAKAAALPTKTGDLAVANKQEHTYTYGLGALRPDVQEGMSLGSTAVTYELGTVSLGSYYDSAKDGAKIEGQTLTLPIEAVDTEDVREIGTVTVIIHTQNFEDMTAAIKVRSVNKTVPTGGPTLSTDTLNYGQTLSAITLSGSMQDNGTSVPGTFAWSSPDNRPAVQEKYAAAWTFTPTDNGKYAIVTGTALIRVLPAPIAGAVIVLDHTAFKYDGQPHRPGITSVTLNGTELTADVDYTAAIPEGTAAGTYTVTLRGTGNYTGEATATFTINPVEQKPLDQKDDAGNNLRLEVETGLSTVPDALNNISEYDTPAKIESALRTKVAAVLSNVGEQIAVFDVTLQYKDGSGTWHNVGPDNFPANGVTAILPYPAGTGITGYTFTVQHLISSGAQAGNMETLAYELTTDGLRCKFSSLSPVAIGYQAVTTPNPQPNPGGSSSGGGSVSTYAVTVEKSAHGKVTSNRTNASNGSTVTLTVTPDSGYVLDTLTVTDSRGNEIKLTAQNGGKYTFTMPGRAVTVKASFVPLPDGTQKPCDGGENCPSRGFTDLGGVGTWYHEAVDYVLRNGLMKGYSNGTFGPNDTLTRAQFAQILFNREGRPAVNYLLQYGDVAEGAWYTEAIRWATSQGVVGGYGNGMFGPNDNITREQLAAMLWRYAGSPAATGKELHFTDADQIGGYALEALRWAVENGVINGYGNGRLGPQGQATRAQAAQMLMN